MEPAQGISCANSSERKPARPAGALLQETGAWGIDQTPSTTSTNGPTHCSANQGGGYSVEPPTCPLACSSSAGSWPCLHFRYRAPLTRGALSRIRIRTIRRTRSAALPWGIS